MDDFLFVNYSRAETRNERRTLCETICWYISFCRVQCTTRTTWSAVTRFVQSCRRTGAPTVLGPRRPRPRRRAFPATWAPAMGTWQTFRLRKKTNKNPVQKRFRRLFVDPETSPDRPRRICRAGPFPLSYERIVKAVYVFIYRCTIYIKMSFSLKIYIHLPKNNAHILIVSVTAKYVSE